MNSLPILLQTPVSIFGIELINTQALAELFIRFGFNFVTILILVRFIYFPLTKQRDYFFAYILISTLIFLLCFLLNNVKLQIGFALGLFAIFGIIRYRTDAVPIKEMTYLFLIIGVSVVNALTNKKVSYAEVLCFNLMILIISWSCEKFWHSKRESRKTITYEKLELIIPARRKELMDDIKARTGLNVSRLEIGNIDFLRDSVSIRIYFRTEEGWYYDEDVVS
jgi:hypothetical protein